MELTKKLVLLACLAPISMALASNPARCIPPSLLQLKAKLGQFHSFEAVKACKDIKLNAWYLDDSAHQGDFNKELSKLKKYSDWQAGPYGTSDSNGYAIKCDYTSPSLPGDDILIQMVFSRKVCTKK